MEPSSVCPKCGETADEERTFCSACREPIHDDVDILPMRRQTGPVETTGPREDHQEKKRKRRAGWSRAPHRFFSRSLVVRILITVAILALLVLGLLLVTTLRGGRDDRTPRLPGRPGDGYSAQEEVNRSMSGPRQRASAARG